MRFITYLVTISLGAMSVLAESKARPRCAAEGRPCNFSGNPDLTCCSGLTCKWEKNELGNSVQRCRK
ncbi:omega-atracotoxin domain-containing protein [Pochonia chlamydosporia 170]|uniref:Omega-atracotoxin domain-containing protein n=1 Tax=Pochonia chlamydosporia 170 TaxID=1380566 RepID=A0A179G3Z0_METCM|nr:omega-atracotoxin domain-containing protein [Pochonia chlamydosporia 170]OAQ72178.1 omega-atracotoxin domain-containing protein [Pochonia chlamydosporia 170]